MEEEACCDPCEREQLKYRVTAEMLREKFRIKAQQCLDIAAEWSKKDDNLCSHGYVVEHEQMAEQFTRRAEMLADGDYLLTGGPARCHLPRHKGAGRRHSQTGDHGFQRSLVGDEKAHQLLGSHG